MAAYTCQSSVHKTAGVATVDSVVLSSYAPGIAIVHRDATDPFYVTTGATVAGTTDPVAAANDTFVVMPGQTLTLPWPANATSQAVVKIICASAKAYSVQGVATRAW